MKCRNQKPRCTSEQQAFKKASSTVYFLGHHQILHFHFTRGFHHKENLKQDLSFGIWEKISWTERKMFTVWDDASIRCLVWRGWRIWRVRRFWTSWKYQQHNQGVDSHFDILVIKSKQIIIKKSALASKLKTFFSHFIPLKCMVLC